MKIKNPEDYIFYRAIIYGQFDYHIVVHKTLPDESFLLYTNSRVGRVGTTSCTHNHMIEACSERRTPSSRWEEFVPAYVRKMRENKGAAREKNKT